MEDHSLGKPYQSACSPEIGLNIPSSLITNDPQQYEFMSKVCGNKVERSYINTSSMPPVLVFNAPLSEKNDLDRLDTLKYAPAIFQERIKGGSDLGIAVIGQRDIKTERDHVK